MVPFDKANNEMEILCSLQISYHFNFPFNQLSFQKSVANSSHECVFKFQPALFPKSVANSSHECVFKIVL